MGSLCSKPGIHSGGHVLVDPSTQNQSLSESNPRRAAAQAAEQRLKSAQERGTHASNPNRGVLAAQAAAPVKRDPEPQPEQRLVVGHCASSKRLLTSQLK
jgi:hypothetical protein